MTKRTTNDSYVLGTGLSHNGSACLLKNGSICVAIEKERITRVKHAGYIDTDAIQYCLESEGITFDDIELIVQNANYCNFERGNQHFGNKLRNIPLRCRVVSLSHHLAHAYSVIGTCPFDEMAILIVDATGSSFDDSQDLEGAALPLAVNHKELAHLFFEKDSYYLYRDQKLKTIFKDFSPWGYLLKGYLMCPPSTMHSIGGLYSAVSGYIFNGMDDPGKLMGLAAYGRPGVYPFEAFDLKDGRVFVNYDWMHIFNRPRIVPGDLNEHFQYYADIAFWIQKEIERALLYVVETRFEMAPSKYLGYAGGVALNAVANAAVLSRSAFEDLYIQPAAGDNGLAVGCAYYGWLEVLKRPRILHTGITCFGKVYTSHEICAALARFDSSIKYEPDPDFIATAARLLASGKVVGWFQGGSEFGPRALGHRSILADPRIPEMGDFINCKIKLREDFRPFAPSVTRDDAQLYFDGCLDSPYMILVARVKEEWKARIPAVVHRDGTARIQTVTKELMPEYYQLLKAFGQHSGIPILLNTSFNQRGSPIVETPEQAIQMFVDSALDVLVIESYVVTKRG